MTEKADFDDRDMVKLTTVSNPVEASVLEGLLTDQDIRCFIKTWHSHAYDGIFATQKGYAEVKVFRDELMRAKLVLADFQRSVEESAAADEDAPEGDAPEGDAPKGDAPKGDAPKGDNEAPGTDRS